jgi:hypothetical protein
MKKIIISLLTFCTLPLTYIGGYHIVRLSMISEASEIFLGMFGGCILIFQAVMAVVLFHAGFVELHGKDPFK